MRKKLSVNQFVRLCSLGEEERQKYDDEAKRRYNSIPDRDGKVEVSGARYPWNTTNIPF